MQPWEDRTAPQKARMALTSRATSRARGATRPTEPEGPVLENPSSPGTQRAGRTLLFTSNHWRASSPEWYKILLKYDMRGETITESRSEHGNLGSMTVTKKYQKFEMIIFFKLEISGVLCTTLLIRILKKLCFGENVDLFSHFSSEKSFQKRNLFVFSESVKTQLSNGTYASY